MPLAQGWHGFRQVDSPRRLITLVDLYRWALASRADRTAYLPDERLTDIGIDTAVDAAWFRLSDDFDDSGVVDNNGIIALLGIRLFIGAA